MQEFNTGLLVSARPLIKQARSDSLRKRPQILTLWPSGPFPGPPSPLRHWACLAPANKPAHVEIFLIKGPRKRARPTCARVPLATANRRPALHVLADKIGTASGLGLFFVYLCNRNETRQKPSRWVLGEAVEGISHARHVMRSWPIQIPQI